MADATAPASEPTDQAAAPTEPPKEAELESGVNPDEADPSAPVPMPAEEKPTDKDGDTTGSTEARRWILGRAVLGEFLATFLFLYIAMAVPYNMSKLDTPINNPATSAIAVSFIAVGVIYSFADISGAHFNPAVTFAVYVTGKTNFTKAVAYISAQLLGAVWASFWFVVTFPNGAHDLSTLALVPKTTIGAGYQLVMEFTLTFILVYVIFSVAFDTVDSKAVEVRQVGLDGERGARNVAARNLTIYTASGNTKAGFAPIAIAFILGMLSLVGGSVSGGAYNPARVFGPAMCSGVWTDQWVFWLGDLAGGAAGGWTQLLFQRLKKYAGTK